MAGALDKATEISSFQFPNRQNLKPRESPSSSQRRAHRPRHGLRRTMEAVQGEHSALESLPNSLPTPQQPLSKSAHKKLLKQQRFEAKKAEKKALTKQHKRQEAERKKKEWAETLASVPEEERSKLIESRRSLRKERMEKRSEEKEKKIERLNGARECGQKIVIDLEFAHLMTPAEIHSLVQQVSFSIPFSLLFFETFTCLQKNHKDNRSAPEENDETSFFPEIAFTSGWS